MQALLFQRPFEEGGGKKEQESRLTAFANARGKTSQI